MKKILLTGTIVAVIVMSLGSAIFAQGTPRVGGYKPAKTDDERVVAAAEFAVSERAENNDQEGLTLDSIDKAETQTVAGTNFRLCLSVSLDDESQQVQTVVYQNLKKDYTLTSWKVVDCAEKSSSEANINDLPMLKNVAFTMIG